MKSLSVAIALGLLAIAPGARADHGCNGAVAQFDTPAGVFYLDDRGTTDADLWLYMESNGVPGLQSGGLHASGEYADRCVHLQPDTLLF